MKIIREAVVQVFGVTSASSVAPDSNLIQNNFVKQAGMAFYVSSYYNASV